jgi:GT2 family glycosyltransferase
MKIGLVTVLFNSAGYLPDYVESLKAQDSPGITALFVDNASSDGSAETADRLMRDSGTEYEILRAGDNLGVAEGNNIGIRRAMELGCEWILLLNNDIAFPPNAVSALLATCAAAGALICTPLITIHGSDRIWMAGGRVSLTAGGFHFGEGQRLESYPKRARWVPYAPTCFMLIARSVFETVGLMDPAYFVYSDDVDFIFRAGKEGIKVYLEPNVVISHKVSGSTGGPFSLFTIRYGTRNRIFFIRKHYRFPEKQIRLLAFLATRIKYLLTLDRNKRRVMLDAVKEGFSMAVLR